MMRIPDRKSIEQEIHRLEHRRKYRKAFMSTVYVLIVVAAVAVLISMLVMPVFHVTGESMEPSLSDGDILLGIKTDDFECGEICGLYYNNKLLLKRTIAMAGSWVDIDEEGNVYVDGQLIDEPYIVEKSLGITDIEYPYQVPDGCVFVLGDNRATSIDSRSSIIGCVPTDEIVGKIFLRIWPMDKFGTVQ